MIRTYAVLALLLFLAHAMKRLATGFDDLIIQDHPKKICLIAEEYQAPVPGSLHSIFHQWSAESRLARKRLIADWAQINSVDELEKLSPIIEVIGAVSVYDLFHRLDTATPEEYHQLAGRLISSSNLSSIKRLQKFKSFPINFDLFIKLMEIDLTTWSLKDAVLLDYLNFEVSESLICQLLGAGVPSTILRTILKSAKTAAILSMQPVLLAILQKRSTAMILELLDRVTRIYLIDVEKALAINADPRVIKAMSTRQSLIA